MISCITKIWKKGTPENYRFNFKLMALRAD
eukprot:SAG31_NODE_24551_length_479_cov_0.678947_1_plen_29_part_01